MGVKYGRKYSEIINELTAAVSQIEGINEFFEMNADQWAALEDIDRAACLRTLSDDLFFALGHDKRIMAGRGTVEYDPQRHILKVYNNHRVSIINLV